MIYTFKVGRCLLCGECKELVWAQRDRFRDNCNSPGERERSFSKALVGENFEKGLGCGCVLKAEGTELIDVVLKKKESARNEPNLGRRADKG